MKSGTARHGNGSPSAQNPPEQSVPAARVQQTLLITFADATVLGSYQISSRALVLGKPSHWRGHFPTAITFPVPVPWCYGDLNSLPSTVAFEDFATYRFSSQTPPLFVQVSSDTVSITTVEIACF